MYDRCCTMVSSVIRREMATNDSSRIGGVKLVIVKLDDISRASLGLPVW